MASQKTNQYRLIRDRHTDSFEKRSLSIWRNAAFLRIEYIGHKIGKCVITLSTNARRLGGDTTRLPDDTQVHREARPEANQPQHTQVCHAAAFLLTNIWQGKANAIILHTNQKRMVAFVHILITSIIALRLSQAVVRKVRVYNP